MKKYIFQIKVNFIVYVRKVYVRLIVLMNISPDASTSVHYLRNFNATFYLQP